MGKKIFRQKSIDRISSAEQMDGYLHVTTPTVWAALAAIILLLAGLVIWSAFTVVETYADGVAAVHGSVLILTLEDEEKAEKLEEGMDILVGGLVTPILSMGETEDGVRIAVAKADLPDGRYDAKVGYKQTRILEILFN